MTGLSQRKEKRLKSKRGRRDVETLALDEIGVGGIARNFNPQEYFSSESIQSSGPVQQIAYAAQVSAQPEIKEDYSEHGNPSIFPLSSTELGQDPNDTWMDFLPMEERLAVYGMQDNFDFEYKRATKEDILAELGMHEENRKHQKILEDYDFS